MSPTRGDGNVHQQAVYLISMAIAPHRGVPERIEERLGIEQKLIFVCFCRPCFVTPMLEDWTLLPYCTS